MKPIAVITRPNEAGVIRRPEPAPAKAQEDELYVLAQSRDRVAKERAMRARLLKRLWARLKQLSTMRLTREELLMKLGAARDQPLHRLAPGHDRGCRGGRLTACKSRWRRTATTRQV